MVERFMEVCMAGDLDGLMSLLAEDVTIWSDGGGKASGAARQPIQGRDKVARAVITQMSNAPDGTTFEAIEANGTPALLIRIKGEIVGVITMEVDGGFIRAARNVANPDKLAHLKLPSTKGKEWRLRP